MCPPAFFSASDKTWWWWWLFFYKDGFGIKLATKVDMPLNKDIKHIKKTTNKRNISLSHEKRNKLCE